MEKMNVKNTAKKWVVTDLRSIAQPSWHFIPMMEIFEKHFMAEGSIFVTSTTQRPTKLTADAAFTVLSQLACCRYQIQ